jgi:OmpA-OmpF porin, OOP family
MEGTKVNMRKRNFIGLSALTLTLSLAPLSIAQTNTSNSASTNNETRARSITSTEKMTIKGVVVKRDADTVTVRDLNGVDTVVRLADNTKIEQKKGGFWGGTKRLTVTSILRGLNLEVKGRGNGSGELVAERIKFSESDFRVANSIDTRVNPVENRVSTAENRIDNAEQNAQRLSGQLEELSAVANLANGGARAAQETADKALAEVQSTNARISALDDFTPQDTASILFRVNSAVLSEEAKTQLDTMAQKALASKGYMIEVSGFTDATGGLDLNRRLSQRRAEAVVRYLAENHRIPLRRIITPFGYGEAQAIADNTTRDGRKQNRRVEVKVLVNNAITQQTASAGASQGNVSASVPTNGQ